MDAILHVFGVCGDAHAHLDLMDILLMGGGLTPIVVYIKYKFRKFKEYFNEKR